MRDPREALGMVEPAVEDVDLLDQLVQPLEDGVELAVVKRLPLGHSVRFYAASRR